MSSRRVREPIQVYLDRVERASLDRLARELEVSRAEVLRRGLEALGRERRVTVYDALAPLVGSVDAPRAPDDLAERHDEHLAGDHDKGVAQFLRNRSS
jgi:hypothetical protein